MAVITKKEITHVKIFKKELEEILVKEFGQIGDVIPNINFNSATGEIAFTIEHTDNQDANTIPASAVAQPDVPKPATGGWNTNQPAPVKPAPTTGGWNTDMSEDKTAKTEDVAPVETGLPVVDNTEDDLPEIDDGAFESPVVDNTEDDLPEIDDSDYDLEDRIGSVDDLPEIDDSDYEEVTIDSETE